MNKLIRLDSFRDEEGRFFRFPGKRRKQEQQLMLECLAAKFKTGVVYTELQVNAILNEHHSFGDPAMLRRLMFGLKMICRTLDGRKYWVEA